MTIVIGLIIVGIVISGFMTIKTGKEERDIENEWIEQEGQKFITAMHEEKKRRFSKDS
ncbi:MULTISPECIES: sporulation YhaL family protein [Bacillus]|uniref:sporulation YhaL family protein n=1 Tax=Bacillus TaxID=1386 RepID=UPI0002EE456D|nr:MULTISPECIES: sporulation YhaL family protein [Bacillus]